MNVKQQIKAQQVMLRVQNNPTSCSNAELSKPSKDRVSSSTKSAGASTMNLVMRDIEDYLELGARNALRIV